jgi:hypothetical protein
MAVKIIFNKVVDFVKDIETNSRNMVAQNAQPLRSYFFFKLGRKKQITPTKGKKEQQ